MKRATSIEDRVWRALGDPIRRRILDELARAPRTTGELAAAFEPLCRTAVMKHLDVLTAAELVVVRRAGRVRWNHFNPVPIDGVCRRWLDAHRQWVSRGAERTRGCGGDPARQAGRIGEGRSRLAGGGETAVGDAESATDDAES